MIVAIVAVMVVVVDGGVHWIENQGLNSGKSSCQLLLLLLLLFNILMFVDQMMKLVVKSLIVCCFGEHLQVAAMVVVVDLMMSESCQLACDLVVLLHAVWLSLFVCFF